MTFNPELVRNCRIQLRRNRMLAAAVICAAVSLSLVSYYELSTDAGPRGLLQVIFLLQALVLVIGGSIYCLQSVQREKDQNTFDFQRITRMTPFELAIGKVFGAPALTYFAVFCLMPVALYAAVASSLPLASILQIYLVLFLGAVTYHCFAVLISMVIERGASAGAMFFFLWAVGATSIDLGAEYQQGPLALRAVGPFWAYSLIAPAAPFPPSPDSPYAARPGQDLFFGAPVSHVAVLTVLYVTFAAWLLLAVVRNIKRDPSIYEIYRPYQALGLALYLNFLVLGFLRWMAGQYTQLGPRANTGFWQFRPISGGRVEDTFLGFSVAIFAILGLALFRNRDRARRYLREVGSSAAGWWAAVWPAPLLAGGMALAAAGMLGMIHARRGEAEDWSLSMGAFQAAFMAAWLARDFIYLQWMNLRRARRPLMTGIIYLGVFYVCAGVVLGALGLFGMENRAVAAIFVPWAAFGLDLPTWLANRGPWLGAWALVIGQAAAFAWLQLRELKDLAAATPGPQAGAIRQA
jgi:hypothetical protein